MFYGCLFVFVSMTYYFIPVLFERRHFLRKFICTPKNLRLTAREQKHIIAVDYPDGW